MRLGEYERKIARQLTEAGVDSPRLCARLLCAYALGLTKLGVALAPERELDEVEAARLAALAARRATGEPLAHITGTREFFGRDFRVTRHTLVPRPETELLVETALELLPAGPLMFADMGTGSGCIGISLACERPLWRGILLEKSAEALRMARENAAALLGREGAGPGASRLALVLADLFAPPLRARALDLVISNPPYIGEGERPQVMDEVLRFEPASALFSPAEGLAHLAAVGEAARRLLRAGGLVILEHGAAQGAAVRGLLARQGFTGIGTRRDLAGLERCSFGGLG
ncbi:MAG: peptide chain release factor N(5)-glutamine methyltransferase [Desulfovibrio sp.]|uniref:peptide chain release factor N(5)-glutamine methyltransferase n=1 Tax=Desulfovibrio sp. TaxID=885 RepID=UPI001A6CCF97|nr:peptide chain release factor N(5)-glutamine methyltransferase [Desulfovibrio sp.]MBD5416384.1 peptide chain release factor N(5)-glutamine methyltransferase [Desulfovibrio sp.]